MATVDGLCSKQHSFSLPTFQAGSLKSRPPLIGAAFVARPRTGLPVKAPRVSQKVLVPSGLRLRWVCLTRIQSSHRKSRRSGRGCFLPNPSAGGLEDKHKSAAGRTAKFRTGPQVRGIVAATIAFQNFRAHVACHSFFSRRRVSSCSIQLPFLKQLNSNGPHRRFWAKNMTGFLDRCLPE